MKTLIIYTHPHRQSLNGAFLQQVSMGLESDPNSSVKILDLYSEGFNPVLNFGPEERRRDMYKRPELEKYRQDILWSEKIVFIYPIWWGRPPAMLLGFIDQMFSSNFAYRDKKNGPLPDGLLGGREVVCISTMKGPTGYLQYWLWNSHRVLMKKALFNFVGIKKVKFFEFGKMESSPSAREKALAKVYEFFKKMTTNQSRLVAV